MSTHRVFMPRPLSTSLSRFSSAVAVTAALIAGVGYAKADTITWDGGGADSLWTTATNWFDTTTATNDILPLATDDLVFGSGGATTVDLAGNQTANSLRFSLNGFTLGLLTTTNTLNNTSGLITVDAGVTGTINAILSNPANGLTLSGGGTLSLAGTNTFTGAVAVNGGSTLSITTDGNLGAVANGVTLNGSTLNVGGTFTSARALTLGTGGGTVNITGANALTLSTALTANANSLTKTGTGTLVLGAASTRTGTTLVSGGTFQLTNVSAAGTGDISVTSGATLLSSHNAATQNFAANVSLDGAIFSQNQAQVLNFAAGKAITIAAGGGTIDVSGGAGATSKVLLATGQLAGSGTLTKTGAGDLQLSGANSGFSGLVNGNAGILEFQNADALGTGTTTITMNGGEFVASNAGTLAVRHNFVLNTGSTLSANGGGTAISYAGGVNVAGASNIALRLFQAPTTAQSFAITGGLSGSGNLSVTAPAAATLTLSGNNSTYSGNISIGTNATVAVTAKQAFISNGFTLAGGTLRSSVVDLASLTLGTSGLNATYFNLGSNTGTGANNFAVDQLYLNPRTFSRTDLNINVPNSSSGTWPIIPNPGFAVGTTAGGQQDGIMWKGLINITNAGNYQFSGTNDDNLVLIIDGVQVGTLAVTANNANIGSAVSLSTGAHSIVVKQTQGGGGGYATLSYNGGAGSDAPTTTIIPGSAFTNGSLASVNLGPITSNGGTVDIAGPSSTSALNLGSGTLTLTSATIDNLTAAGGQITAATPVLAPTTAGLIVTGAITEASAGLGLTMAGPYFAEFRGANTYTGATTVTAGQLRLNSSGGPSIKGDLVVNAPNASGAIANVRLLQSNQIADTASVTMTTGILDVGANNDTIANLTVNGGSILGTGGVLTVTNAPTLTSGFVGAGLGGNYNLVKGGAGTVILAGTGTFTGVTNVNAGILNSRGINSLGAGGAGNETIVASGATLQLVGGNNGGENVTISGTGVTEFTQNGALRNLGGISQINNLTTGAVSTVQVDSGELLINGTLNVAGGALTKTGAGTLTFTTNQASIPAVTLAGGALGFSGPQSFGAATVPAGLAYQFDSDPGAGVSVTVNGTSSVIGNFGVNQTFLSRLTAASNGTLVLTGDNANNLDFSAGPNVSLGARGTVTYSGSLTPNSATYRLGGGDGRLNVTSVLSGSNSLEINGEVHPNAENTFTGGISVNSGGKLVYVNDPNLGAASNTVTLNGGTLQIANNADNTSAVLFVNLGNQLSGGGRVISVGAAGGTIDIPARQATGNAFAITSPNGLIGSGPLTKTGLGIGFVFSSNSYSGALTLAANSNRFDIRANGALPNVSSITINQSARLDIDNNNGQGQRQFASVDVRNRLNDAAPISLAGGTLRFVARNATFAAGSPATSQENFGATTLAVGQSTINSTRTGGGGSDMVIANLIRTYGNGTVQFTADNNTLGQSGDNPRIILTQVNGVAPTNSAFLGGWATLGAGDFAAYGANSTVGGASGTATGITNYGSTGAPTYTALTTTTAPGANGWATGSIGSAAADNTLGTTGAGQNFVVGALRLSGGATRQILFGGTTGTADTLFVESGGILSDNSNNARNIGTTTSAFTRGRLTAGSTTATTPQELFIHNNQNTFTINSQIIDNPNNAAATVKVVKDLDGTVVLDSGTNTYSGGTLVLRGTLTANNTGSLGTGGVTVKNAVLNLGNKGSTTGAVGVAANSAVYTALDQSQIVLTNNTAGAAGQYNAAGDRFSIDTGSSIYANSPGAGFGFNSLTRVATPTSFTAGGQIYLAPGAIVKHNMTNAPDQGSGTLTIQNLGTNADLFFAPGANGGVNQTITVGAGTPWAGLSSDRTGNLTWNQGTIFANSDFTLQGLTRDNGLTTLILGVNTAGTAPVQGGVQIVNNTSGPINANVVGAVAISEDEPVMMPSNLTFVLKPGSIFQPNTSMAMGFGTSQAKILVQAGGTLDPGNYTALGATANTTLNADGTANGFQNLPYALPSPVNGNVTVQAGGRFLINDASGIGSAPAGAYTLKSGSILDLGNTNAFFGRGNYALNQALPVDTTGLANVGQFVYEPNVVVKIQADNIYKLTQFVPIGDATKTPVIEIFGANRTLTSQNNPFMIPVVGTPTIAPEDINISNGTILTNDDSDRQINEGRGRLIIGNGSIIAPTTETYLNVQESIVVPSGATITLGSTRTIDGVPKLGGLQLVGPNSNEIAADATINMLNGTQILLTAQNTWPDARGLNLPLAVTAFPSPGGTTLMPGNGTSLGLNAANFMEVMGPLTGNGAVIANQSGTVLATGFGATSDFTSNVVFKSTNGQNPGLAKIGSTKMTLTGVSDSTGEAAVIQGETVISGTGSTKFNWRAQKGAKLTIDNSGTAANNRTGNPSSWIPSGGAFELIGNATTPVNESVQSLAISATNLANNTQNPGITTLNITPGAAQTTMTVGAFDNFQNAATSLPRTGTWVLRSPAMGNAPGSYATSGVYTANGGNSTNGVVMVNTPNFVSTANFGVGAGGLIIGAAGSTVAPTRPDYLGDTNANGAGTGFMTADGILIGGITTNGSNSITSVTNTTGLAVGQVIVGAGIPANTTIAAIAGSTLTISANATASATVGMAVSGANSYMRLLASNEYSSSFRDNQSTAQNVKLSGVTTATGDTRVQTLTMSPGSTLNLNSTLPLGVSGTRVHLNGGGLFVQGGGAAVTINGDAHNFLQANTGASLFMHVQGDLNLNVPVFSDQGVVKTGLGTLNVGSGAFNVFRGSFQLDQGVVNLAANNSFANIRGQTGFTSNNNLYLNGGTLNLNGNSEFIGLLNASNELPGMGGTVTSSSPATIINVGGGRFSGTIGGSISLYKPGNNTLLLTNDNTYSGTTKLSAGTLLLRDSGMLSGSSAVDVNYATLALDNSGLSNVSNRIPAATPVTLRGGTINITGVAGQVASQTFNTLTLAEGLNNFTSNAGGSGANEINIGNLVRTQGPGGSGAMVNFQSNYGFLGAAGNTTAVRDFISNVNGSPLSLNDGIIGGWAVVNGDSFATYLPSTGVGAYGNIQDGYRNFESTDATAATAIQNVNDGAARTFTTSKTINSWRIAPNAAVVMTFNDGVGLTIDSGGLLTNNNNTTSFNAAANARNNSITSNSGELNVWVNQNTSGINIPITGNIDVVKSGGGALNLNPNSSLTATVTSGSNVVTMANTAGLEVGDAVSGTGIPAGTTITAITANTSITLSSNATAAAAAITATFGNSYTGKTIVNGGTLTLNEAAASQNSLAVPGDLIIQSATVTEANVGGQIKNNANITIGGGGRLNMVNAGGVTETLGSLTFLDGAGGNGTANGLDRTATQPTSTINLSAATAITSTNTNPSTGVPFIGGFAGLLGFTNAAGSTLNISSPVTVNGNSAVGLRIDATIAGVPTGVAEGGLIKSGNGLLVLNPTAVTTTASTVSSTTTNGSATITMTSTAGLVVGQPVSGAAGTGIPGGSFITNVVNGTTITINQNATTSATNNLTYSGTGINQFGSPTGYNGNVNSLTDVFNIQQGVVRVDQAGALGSNSANTTVQNGAVLLGSNSAGAFITGSIKLNDGATLGATINGIFLGNPTSTVASQSVLNVPAGAVNIAAYDYFVPGTNNGNITVNGRLTGSGTINVVGPRITQGGGGGGVIQLANLITTGAGSNDFNGTIVVGENAILASQQYLLGPATSVTGNELGSASISLNGGRLRLRDDFATDNSNVSNATATYGNNVTLLADSYLDANRTVGSGTNNTINLGTLTVPSGTKTLNVDSTNGYQAGFASLDGAGSLIKAGAGRLNINAIAGTYTGGIGIAGPQGLVVAPTFNTTTTQNLVLPTTTSVSSFNLNGLYITEAGKTLNVSGAFSVNANQGDIASNKSNVPGALAVNSTTTLNVGSFVNNGTVGAAGGAATITSTGGFTGAGLYVTNGQQLNLAGNIGAGTFRVSGDNLVNVTGTNHNLANAEVQNGTLQLAPIGAASTTGNIRVLGSPASTASGTSAAIAAVSGTLRLDGSAGSITHTGNITNSGTVRVAAGTTTVTGTVGGTSLQYTPGLLEGFTTAPGGVMDVSTGRVPNPGNFGLRMEPRMLQTNAVTQQALTGHTDNDTWIYTGYVKDDDGVFSFAENIDDRAAVWIDGALVLNASNGGTSRVVSTAYSMGQQGTAPVNGSNLATPSQNFGAGISLPGFGSGWHLIEIRMNNGTGGSGPITGNGFGVNYGFGYKNGIAALDGADMIKPIDDGTGNLFVTPVGGKGTVQVDAAATLNVGGINTTSNVLLNGDGAAVNITSAGSSNTDSLTLAAGVTSGSVSITSGATVTVGAGVGTGLSVSAGGTLTRSGAGTLTIPSGSGQTIGSGGLLKLTAGQTILSGDGTGGTGNIEIDNAGTLAIINGTAGGGVIINGGTLEGSGTISGDVVATAASGGTVAPGNSPGVLTMGTLTSSSPAVLSLEIGRLGGGSPVAGLDYDQIKITGNTLDLTGTGGNGGSTFLTLQLAGSIVQNDVFTVILNNGADTDSGTLQMAGFGELVNGATFSQGGFQFRISYFDNPATSVQELTGGNSVSILAVVPEPGSATIAVAGLALAAGLRRFRRRS